MGVFDHEGVRRGQNAKPLAERIPGPYRVDWIMDEGVDLVITPPVRSRLHRKVRDVVEHRSGVRVDVALRGALRSRRLDAVLCMLEDKAVLPGAMKARGLPPFARVPLSVISCWWAEEILHGTPETRERIEKATANVDRIFTFSQNQVGVFDLVGAGDKVVPVRFGVDETWYTPEAPTRPPMQVVAMGIDRGRDFDSLIGAAQHTQDIRYDIFTQRGRLDASRLPKNVTLHEPTTMTGHRENLRAADLIVVPTHDLAYPTGQSVLLEAMACGRCVAVTETAAMKEYIDDGISNVALPLHDADGMAGTISRLVENPALRSRIGAEARRRVEQEFSFRHTWRQIAASLRELTRPV